MDRGAFEVRAERNNMLYLVRNAPSPLNLLLLILLTQCMGKIQIEATSNKRTASRTR
jgi:hypothetical protein